MEPTSLPAEAVWMSDEERREVFTVDQSDRPIPLKDQDKDWLVKRHFTKAGEDPFNTVFWSVRDAWPEDDPYHMKDIEAPSSWSQQAVNITAKLYLAKGVEKETSVRQLVHRVANRIVAEGIKAGYLGAEHDYLDWLGDIGNLDEDHEARVFYDELVYICLHQMATFNSPVWFNIGRDDRPQCPSACFLLGVDDDSESIMRWARDEAFIFKSGSGSSANVSHLRAAGEPMSVGGSSSGPVSFMRLPNTVAETFKSGGVTRRAARMVQMDVDHPDILDFIDCKVREEDRLRILAEAGLEIGLSAEGERNVAEATSYQSANNSVRVTDDFMKRATDESGTGLPWQLIPRKGGPHHSVNANDLLDTMASAAHVCADPGVIFHDTVNRWHTTPADGPIRVSNACSETHLPDDSSCNLGALNVVKFLDDDGNLHGNDALQTIDVMTTAMDILVEFCELPTERLVERTKRYRWLGLGCSNMGAAIMSRGLAYDSDKGRDFAASVMSIITARCYHASARIAGKMGPFDGYADNRQSMLSVISRHRQHFPDSLSTDEWVTARHQWRDAQDLGSIYGYRNAQASVIAPGGTTSFFMDCDTTGIEPSFSLVQYKDLAGGGSMVLINESVGRALKTLGYEEAEIKSMLKILRRDGVEAFMISVNPQHHAVFHGANDISANGHIKMLAAVQPWISGAASKTVNLPSHATPTDIRDCFVMAWKLGVKCIAVYRDGSKARQVLSSKKKDVEPAKTSTEQFFQALGVEAPSILPQATTPQRRRLPRTRPMTIRHKISVQSAIGLHEGYVSASFFDDGSLGEVFLEGFGRMGGFTQNALSAWMTGFSVALQYGVPFDVLVRKHIGHSDETGGMVTPDHDGQSLVIRSCESMIDYVARWLVSVAGDVDLQEDLGVMTDAVKARKSEALTGQLPARLDLEADPLAVVSNGNGHAREAAISAQECPECRKPMRRAGACLQCSCGYHTGCG